MTALSLITFDVGGTLLSPSPSVGEAYAEELRQLGHATDPQRLESRFQAALRDWETYRKSEDNAGDDQRIWRGVVAYTLAEEGIPAEKFDAAFAHLYEAFSRARRWRMLEDVPEVLRTLHERGNRLAVLSNSDSRTRNVLREHDLLDFFEAVFLSGEIGYEKPDARIFHHVAQAMQVQPASILHVGDSPRHDHLGAANAGYRSFLIASHGHKLRDLLDLVQ